MNDEHKVNIGDLVAYFHGMPVDIDYGVVLDKMDDLYLCYDPFHGWEFTSTIRTAAVLHDIGKIAPEKMENTRTNWTPHKDERRFSHTVAEAVEYAKQSGLFEAREKSEWWRTQKAQRQ